MTATPPGRKRSGTTVDEIVEMLRDRIVSGDLAPGVRLSQQYLAEEFEVSRTPLREALQRLTTEGYVISQANRGMIVAPASLEHVEDSYAFRLLVEPALTAAVVHSVTREDLAAMGKALVRMEDAGVSTREFQEDHWQFHRVVLERYPSHLADLVRQDHHRMRRLQRIYFSRPAAVADFTDVDELLLQAIRDRDAEGARHLLEFHLLDAALGMLLEVEPDHEFDALLTTLRGLGIQVKGLGGIGMHRPGELTWTRDTVTSLPTLKTSNIKYTPSI